MRFRELSDEILFGRAPILILRKLRSQTSVQSRAVKGTRLRDLRSYAKHCVLQRRSQHHAWGFLPFPAQNGRQRCCFTDPFHLQVTHSRGSRGELARMIPEAASRKAKCPQRNSGTHKELSSPAEPATGMGDSSV